MVKTVKTENTLLLQKDANIISNSDIVYNLAVYTEIRELLEYYPQKAINKSKAMNFKYTEETIELIRNMLPVLIDKSMSEWQLLDQIDLETSKCQLCNQPIKNKHYIQHKKRGDVLTIGGICYSDFNNRRRSQRALEFLSTRYTAEQFFALSKEYPLLLNINNWKCMEKDSAVILPELVEQGMRERIKTINKLLTRILTKKEISNKNALEKHLIQTSKFYDNIISLAEEKAAHPVAFTRSMYNTMKLDLENPVQLGIVEKVKKQSNANMGKIPQELLPQVESEYFIERIYEFLTEKLNDSISFFKVYSTKWVGVVIQREYKDNIRIRIPFKSFMQEFNDMLNSFYEKHDPVINKGIIHQRLKKFLHELELDKANNNLLINDINKSWMFMQKNKNIRFNSDRNKSNYLEKNDKLIFGYNEIYAGKYLEELSQKINMEYILKNNNDISSEEKKNILTQKVNEVYRYKIKQMKVYFSKFEWFFIDNKIIKISSQELSKILVITYLDISEEEKTEYFIKELLKSTETFYNIQKSIVETIEDQTQEEFEFYKSKLNQIEK